MKLSELDMIRLLPAFMRKDGAAIGLSEGTDALIRETMIRLPVLRKWDQIDNMTAEQLDEMAWELNVLWYDPGASIETKRRLIKNSDIVYSRLGTRWAVEEVIAAYFGDATMLEFWEYEGGRPHYFKIRSNNPEIVLKVLRPFLWALEIVKRKSQWLDGIVLELQTSGNVYAGIVTHDTSWEKIYAFRTVEDMNPAPYTLYAGMAYYEGSMESVNIKGGVA